MKEDQFQQLQTWRLSQWHRCRLQIHFLRYLLSYLSSSSTLCTGSNFLKILGWTKKLSLVPFLGFLTVVIPFSQSDFVMNNIVYSFWGKLYYSYVLVFFSEFLYADVFFSRKLIQRVSSFLVSLWFSSLVFVSCNLLWLENKGLRPDCNKVVYQNTFVLGQGSK